MANNAMSETETYFGRQGHLFENAGESTDLALMVDALALRRELPGMRAEYATLLL